MFIKIFSKTTNNQKVKDILNLYTGLMKQKTKVLSEETYIGIVEICLKNGNLNHASYFLCQMDRLKISIPRKVLDMFLDYSIMNKNFENNEKVKESDNENFVREMIEENQRKPKNQYDSGYYNTNNDYSQDPEYDYYYNTKNHYKKRIDSVKKDFNNLRLNKNSKPYIPKKVSNDSTSGYFKINKITLNPNAKVFVPSNKNNISSTEAIKEVEVDHS